MEGIESMLPDDLEEQMQHLPTLCSFTYKGSRRVVVDALVNDEGIMTGFELKKGDENTNRIKSYKMREVKFSNEQPMFITTWGVVQSVSIDDVMRAALAIHDKIRERDQEARQN